MGEDVVLRYHQMLALVAVPLLAAMPREGPDGATHAADQVADALDDAAVLLALAGKRDFPAG